MATSVKTNMPPDANIMLHFIFFKKQSKINPAPVKTNFIKK